MLPENILTSVWLKSLPKSPGPNLLFAVGLHSFLRVGVFCVHIFRQVGSPVAPSTCLHVEWTVNTQQINHFQKHFSASFNKQRPVTQNIRDRHSRKSASQSLGETRGRILMSRHTPDKRARIVTRFSWAPWVLAARAAICYHLQNRIQNDKEWNSATNQKCIKPQITPIGNELIMHHFTLMAITTLSGDIDVKANYCRL